jgi:hypothetical protein
VRPAEYLRIIEINRVSLFYRISNEPSTTILDRGNIFPITFTPFYVLVKFSPAFTSFLSIDLKNDWCVFF